MARCSFLKPGAKLSSNGPLERPASEKFGYSEAAQRAQRSRTATVDIAIRLMPPTKGTDWGHFYRFGDEWQSELKAAISRHVSLVLLPTAQDIGPRILLWTRE